MKVRTVSFRFLIVLLLMSVLITACSSDVLATPTEMEVIIGPPNQTEEAAAPPKPTATLRPTSTPTVEPAAGPTIEASPTNTLDPYNTLIQQGLEFRLNGEFDQAVAQFSQAIQMEPENPVGYYERGRGYLDQNRPDEAITEFNLAINYDANYADAYNARGVAWLVKQQNNQALIEFEKALEINPELTGAYSNRAQVYLNTQKYEEALADFTTMVELNPDDPEAYFNRGQAYVMIVELTGAADESYIDLCIADFNQAIAMVADASDSFTNRGLCYLYKDDLQNAFNDFSQAIELDAENYKVYLLRAALFPGAGTEQQALQDAQTVLDNTTDAEYKQQAQLMLAEIPKFKDATPTP